MHIILNTIEVSGTHFCFYKSETSVSYCVYFTQCTDALYPVYIYRPIKHEKQVKQPHLLPSSWRQLWLALVEVLLLTGMQLGLKPGGLK